MYISRHIRHSRLLEVFALGCALFALYSILFIVIWEGALGMPRAQWSMLMLLPGGVGSAVVLYRFVPFFREDQ